MPGLDGFEVAALLSAGPAGRRPRLVATTALGDEETKARTAAAGFALHLTKPIDVTTLIDAVTRLGEALPDPQE